MALAGAVERLAPARAVYCDPAWDVRRELVEASAYFAVFKNANRTMISSLNPRWDAADVDIELATLADWDPATARVLPAIYAVSRTPRRAVVPSLVLLAGASDLVRPGLGEELVRRGFEVRTVEGAGHSLYRDDLDGFLGALDGWI